MGIAIDSYVSGTDYFFTEEFKVMARSIKDELIANSTELSLVDRAELNAFRYNFYRLLKAKNVRMHLWWVNAFINDIINPYQDTTAKKSIFIVDEEILNKAVARNNTTRG
jgi:hypothetical protein